MLDLLSQIADFGLSNLYQHGKFLQTFCGSPLYASPEIVNGKPYTGPEVSVCSPPAACLRRRPVPLGLLREVGWFSSSSPLQSTDLHPHLSHTKVGKSQVLAGAAETGPRTEAY